MISNVCALQAKNLTIVIRFTMFYTQRQFWLNWASSWPLSSWCCVLTLELFTTGFLVGSHSFETSYWKYLLPLTMSLFPMTEAKLELTLFTWYLECVLENLHRLQLRNLSNNNDFSTPALSEGQVKRIMRALVLLAFCLPRRWEPQNFEFMEWTVSASQCYCWMKTFFTSAAQFTQEILLHGRL